MARLSSVPSGVVICRNRNHDGTMNQKLKFVKNRVWGRHHSLFQKTKEKSKKINKVCEKPDFGYKSRLRVRKVLTPHNARPKTTPLIKCAKVMWFFKIFIFPQNNIKGCTKETIFFFIFQARQGLIPAPTYLHLQWRIKVTQFYMKNYLKNDLNILIFLKPFLFKFFVF